MGIVDAFHGLGTEGAATLRAVAPGVSEALITTAAGLAGGHSGRHRLQPVHRFSAGVWLRAGDFSRELLNSLEEIGPRKPKQDPMEREATSGLHR